jgi:hypothetical protein
VDGCANIGFGQLKQSNLAITVTLYRPGTHEVVSCFLCGFPLFSGRNFTPAEKLTAVECGLNSSLKSEVAGEN